jgi:hypothetical protein
MSLRDEYLDWKIEHVNKPFSYDEEFFEGKYHTVIPPVLKDLFKELMAIDERLCAIEHNNRVKSKEL